MKAHPPFELSFDPAEILSRRIVRYSSFVYPRFAAKSHRLILRMAAAPRRHCFAASAGAREHDNGGLNVSVNIHRPRRQAAKRSRWVSVIYAVTAVAEYSQISVRIRGARERWRFYAGVKTLLSFRAARAYLASGRHCLSNRSLFAGARCRGRDRP